MCIKMIYNHFYLKMYSSIKQQSSTEWNHNYFITNPVLHQCSFLSFYNCTIVCSVQSLSHVQLFLTPWTAACQASLSISNCQSPPKPMSIKSVMPSNRVILCRPLLLLPSIFPSIRAFSNESSLCIRWPKYWGFSFNISPSNEHPGPISFRMDWLDLIAVQKDSQESSPAPQFKTINSSALGFLYSPSLTSIHDHWKNHSLDQTDLCWPSNVSAF